MRQKHKIVPNTLVPKTAVLELTYECNHRCVFCSVPWEHTDGAYGKQKELSIGEWKTCIDTLVDLGVRTLALSGGEPLLKKGFVEILSYARSKRVQEPVFNTANEISGYKEKPFEISVITNGELVDAHWVSIFQEYQCVLIVSLPGIKTFRELTGGGDPQKALNAIRMSADVGIDVVVSICVSKKNLPELFENISLGCLYGARQLLLNRFLPGGRGVGYASLCLTKEETIQMLDIAEEVCWHAQTLGSVGTELPRCIVQKEYRMIKTGTVCSGGVDFFAIDPSGRVRPCNHSPVQLGDYRDIQGAIATQYWQKFKHKDFLPKMCAGCASSLQCDGGCREAAHIVGGDLEASDPVFMKT